MTRMSKKIRLPHALNVFKALKRKTRIKSESVVESHYPRNDVEEAVMFLLDTVEPQMVLLVQERNNIPYVKRALIKSLGEPRKTIDDELFYRTFSVRVEVERYIDRWKEHPMMFRVDT